MTEAEVRYIQRLPSQLNAARAKVATLEAAAMHYGMNDLLTNKDLLNMCWEETVRAAKAKFWMQKLNRLPRRSKVVWTEANEAALKSMARRGMSGSEIARKIPGATRCAVIGKASRMGIKLGRRHSTEGGEG